MQNLQAAYTESYSAGRLKFDTPRKMKVDDNPFPGEQNMVDAGLLKGKTKAKRQPNQKKLEQSIPRCKYRLMSTERLEDVVPNKRADTSRERHRKQR